MRLLLLFGRDFTPRTGHFEFLECAADGRRIVHFLLDLPLDQLGSEITPFTGWSGSVTMNDSSPMVQPCPAGFWVTTKS